MKKALVFGVTGQDGIYLSKFLLKKGYEVHGVKRKKTFSNSFRVDYINSILIKKKIFFFISEMLQIHLLYLI